MVLCAVCGFENRESARFCKNCGKPLSVPSHESVPQPTPLAPFTPPVEPAPATPPALPPAAEVANAAEIPSEIETPLAQGREGALPAVYEIDAETLPDDDPPLNNLGDNSGDDIGDDTKVEPTEAVASSQGTEMDPELVEIELETPRAAGTERPVYSGGPRRPLARGTLIAERFLIVGIDAYDGEPTIYTVEDRGICPSCGARVTASDEEPFCPECGANLLGDAASRKMFDLREVDASDAAPEDTEDDAPDSSAFVWQGRRFERVQPLRFGADAGVASDDRTLGATSFKAGVNLLVGQRSDVGMARAGRPDEDSVFALTMTGIYDSSAGPTFGLYIVCDGMGGHGDGEIASRIAAKTISGYLIQTLLLPLLQGAELKADTIKANISTAIRLANRHVIEDSVLRSNDMGTTLTMAVVIDRDLYVANVGDSRTYLWNAKGLTRLTEDHSAVFQMMQEGEITEDAIYTHPARNQINRSLGMAAPVEPDHFHAELSPGSVLVLCCDGLWEVLRSDGIADVLMLGLHDPQTICDTMIRQANEAGGPDNISVIVVRAEA